MGASIFTPDLIVYFRKAAKTVAVKAEPLGKPTVSEMAAMFCTKCGAKIEPDSKFCKECGTSAS